MGVHNPIKTMRAAILVELKKPLIVDTVELPPEIEVGQVLVKILYTGICGTQIGEQQGVKGEDKFLPHLLGHEATAKVIAVGPGVKVTKPEDTVVLHWRKGEGIQADGAKYRWNGTPLNSGWITTFNEYSIVSENRCTPVSPEVDLESSSLLGCAVSTGMGVITNNAKVKIGESVVVFGAGGVGFNVIEAAALTSAYPIIAVDLYDEKLALAKVFGATHCVNSRTQNAEQEIRKILDKAGADVVVDNTGNVEVIQLAYSLARDVGRVILVGVPKKGDNISIYSLPLHFGKVLTGSFGGESHPTTDIPRFLKLASIGKLKLRELVTDRTNLDGINAAMEKMRAGQISGRCVVKM